MRPGRKDSGGRREEGGVPCGAEALLGFPCPSGCSVGDVPHAGNVGFSGCEIASTGDCQQFVVNLYVEDEGEVNRDVYPAELDPSCSLSAIF